LLWLLLLVVLLLLLLANGAYTLSLLLLRLVEGLTSSLKSLANDLWLMCKL